jgi:cell division ATPase FtsA
MSILPAKGIRNGSVQNTPNFCNAIKELLTANESSMGSSGGITLVS